MSKSILLNKIYDKTMRKYLFVFFFALLQLSTTRAQTQLEDQALYLVQSLDELIRSRIGRAHNELRWEQEELLTYSTNLQTESNIAIDQAYAGAVSQIVQIKELAGNVDISSCVDQREQILNNLPNERKDGLTSCITTNNNLAATIISDANYLVDITMNVVFNYRNQLSRCGPEILCLGPLIQQIELSLVELPQRIDQDVNSAMEHMSEVKVLVDNCRDIYVADFVGVVNDLVSDVATCVDEILGKY